MLNQYEVPALIADELPEMKDELRTFSSTLNINKTMQCFNNFLKEKVLQHRMNELKQGLLLAEKIYNKGNAVVKTAIENSVVYSFFDYLYSFKREERLAVHAMCPITLYSLYINQVNHSSI